MSWLQSCLVFNEVNDWALKSTGFISSKTSILAFEVLDACKTTRIYCTIFPFFYPQCRSSYEFRNQFLLNVTKFKKKKFNLHRSDPKIWMYSFAKIIMRNDNWVQPRHHPQRSLQNKVNLQRIRIQFRLLPVVNFRRRPLRNNLLYQRRRRKKEMKKTSQVKICLNKIGLVHVRIFWNSRKI